MFSQSFILLIVLCIGWMGVANASVQSMHWEMLMQSDMSSMPQHTMSEHCHQPSIPMKTSNDFQDQVSSSQHQQHLNCPDCQIMHCQSVNADLPQATSILTEQSSTDVATTQYWSDHRTNLAGYWQEILRPPKA